MAFFESIRGNPSYDLFCNLCRNLYNYLGPYIWTLILIPAKKLYEQISVKWLGELTKKIKNMVYSKRKDGALKSEKYKGVSKPSLNIIFVGRSGCGKASTIKSIANKECKDTLLRVPGIKLVRNKDSFGRHVFAAKCTGFQQTETEDLIHISDINNFKNAQNILIQSHAIVFCTIFAPNLRKEEIEYIEMLKSELGESEFKKKLMLVMTHTEEFDNSIQQYDCENIVELLLLLGSNDIKKLLQACENRCVLFNNKTENEQIRKSQAEDFFKMVEAMLNNTAFHNPVSNQKYDTEYQLPRLEAIFNQSESKTDVNFDRRLVAAPSNIPDDCLTSDTSRNTRRSSSGSQRTVVDTAPIKLLITVLILGRRDRVNSMIANFITRKEIFEINHDFGISTEIVPDTLKFMFDGQWIRIVKCAGLVQNFNVNISKSIIERFPKPISEFDAIIFAIAYVPENLEDEIHAVENLESIMRRKVFENQGILVSIGRNPVDLDQIKSDQKFQCLLAKFENRVIFFNNQSNDKEDEKHQVTKLINLVETVRAKINTP